MVDTLSYPLPDDPIVELPARESASVAGHSVQDDERRAWRKALGVGLGTFVISRLLVLGGAYSLSILDSMARQQRRLPIARSTRGLIERHFIQWDGRWYKLIAETGYQSDLPERITYIPNNGGATIAFFPLYPYLSRWFDYIVPGGINQALLGINIVLSVIAVVLVGLLAREIFDVETAQRAMVLFCLFPGAVVMSWSYSEPTLIVCAGACLFALIKERWLIAGIFAALGTATRPNGVALVAACVVAAGIAIYRNRQWKSLIAVVLSPLGGIAYYLYLRVHTGEPNAWSRAQRDAWGEWWSWGATAVRYVWRFFENPLGTGFGPLYMHTTFAIAAFGVGAFCAVRKRLPWPMVTYVAVIGVMMVGPGIVSARPRFVWTAFPLAIAVAAWWPRKNRYAWDGLVVACAGSLVAFTVLYGGWAMIP
ncbi:MAG: glycosyltransferase family 39 protein [Actinomycetota bacterium]|nr:glycosyltransferase family 39 protein [Actinomycetota bacterium]